MNDKDDLKAGHWYWLRHDNGSLAPFRLHRTKKVDGRLVGEFYVGSMLSTWSLGRVVAQAEMPRSESAGDKPKKPKK